MPLVTLTTDFGTQDSYVAQMKGVLLSEGASGLGVIDLSHAIGAQDVIGAALFAEAAFPRFPPDVVHVLVVDPGVGSARRAIVAHANGQYLVGPDNGALSRCLTADAQIHEIDISRLPGPISCTFHGRDVFARVGAMLSRGVPLQDIGPTVTDPIMLTLSEPLFERDRVIGEVIHVDRFGNLISNVTRAALVDWAAGATLEVHCGDLVLGQPLSHYGQAETGSALTLFDSSDRLEVAVREGSAATTLGLERGDRIEVRRRP